VPERTCDRALGKGGAAALPSSTLEVNGAHLNFYAPVVADRFAWYLVMLQRAITAGEPIQIDTLQTSLGGDLVRITYPETGEQLARRAYERLLVQGAPRTALRYRGEAAERIPESATVDGEVPGHRIPVAIISRDEPPAAWCRALKDGGR
jgi:hypothetical protein